MAVQAGIDLSVVIPAFNEAVRLPDTLAAFDQWIGGQDRRCELILVDDGSLDDTLRVMETYRRSRAQTQVVSLEHNCGKGRAVAAGVVRSRGALVLFSDADLSTPWQETSKLEEAITAGADIAIASRAVTGAQIERHQEVYREWMGRMFNHMVRWSVLPGIRDTQCGFKLFKGPIAHRTFSRLVTDGFAFDVEVLLRARRLGYRIVEVPVRWSHSPPSTVVPWRDSIVMMFDLGRIRMGRED